MPSFREERLQERVAAVRPRLSKAREIAEKAESENRAMTAEEQKSYDEIMTEGRAVADAVKQHHHDQEVWAFAKATAQTISVQNSAQQQTAWAGGQHEHRQDDGLQEQRRDISQQVTHMVSATEGLHHSSRTYRSRFRLHSRA